VTVLNKKLRRDLLQSKGMLCAIIALIAVGTSFLIGMTGTYNNLNHSKLTYYSKCRMADFWIDLKKAPIANVDRALKETEGISEIRTRISYPAIIDLKNVDKPLSATVISMPESNDKVINSIHLKNGSYFTPGKKNEVIVSARFAKARNIRPGSYISIIIKGQKKKLYVIGTAISSEYVFMVPPGSMCPNTKDYAVFWVKEQFAQDTLGYNGTCNSIVGIFSRSDQINRKKILESFSQKLEQYGVFTSTLLKNQQSNLSLSSEMSAIQSMATMLPIIFLGVAALVLNVIMTRLAEQERVVIGTLKALGVRNFAIFGFYLKYSLFVGLAGGVLGCLLGNWMAAGMTQMYLQFFTFPHLHNSVYPSTMLAGILISLFFSIVGTIRGVKLMLALNPAEAMHPPPPANGKKIFLERYKKLWNMLGFRSQIVVRGIFRNKFRTIIGMTAAAFGSGLVLMSLGMEDCTDYMMHFQFKNVIHSNYQIHFKTPLSYEALFDAKKLPGVTYAEPQLELAAKFVNGKHSKICMITGIIPDSKLLTPCNRKKEKIRIPETGILMTKRLAEQLNVKPGEYITFTTIRGNRKPHRVKLVNTIESTIGIPIYINYSYFNKLLEEDHAITNILIKADQTPKNRKLFLEALKKLPTLTSYNDTKISEQQINAEMSGTFNSMVYSMIFFAAIIFFGSILNSALISISERKREIATFRVLGYRPMEIGSLFLREALLINMTGAIIGLPIGYILLYGTCLTFNNDMFSMPIIVNFSSYIWTLILSFIFIMCSYYIIQKTINKLDWSEALKAKE
jgi:putative ABC transport system permease protein